MYFRTLLLSGVLIVSLSLSGLATARPKDTSVEKLSRISYLVTQEGATEKPFENAHWDNYEAGIYVDIIDGTPLFLSKDKYDSGTGWPTFSHPIRAKTLEYHEDTSS